MTCTRLSLALAALAALVLSAPDARADLRLGVVAPRGEVKALSQWQPFADYLSGEIGEAVELLPVAPGAALDSFSGGDFDALIGNPVHSAVAVETMGAKPVASLVKRAGADFAGVIIARAGSGIETATDLKGKKVISLSTGSAGAYMFQAAHLSAAGLSVPSDFAAHSIGKNQDDLVKLVVRGVFDAAFVRTGVVEAMVAEGAIALEDLVVVDARETEGFGLLHTTRLYPEWFVVAESGLSEDQVTRLHDALVSVPADHPAATAARIQGFVEPRDPSPVVDAMRALRVPPFDS